MYLWPAATAPWQMCAGNECGLWTSGQLRLCCQYFITKAEICLVPTKPAMKLPMTVVPHFPFFLSTVRHYGPVIGTRVLNWMDLLCQYIEPYIPIISYRHNPRSLGFNFVSNLSPRSKMELSHCAITRCALHIHRTGENEVLKSKHNKWAWFSN